MSPSAAGQWSHMAMGLHGCRNSSSLPAPPGLLALQYSKHSSAVQEELLLTKPIALQGKVPAQGRTRC